MFCFVLEIVRFSTSRCRCIFILPEDLHTINDTTVPYELDVDIIKDCSNFKNEIREVLDVIDRDGDQYPIMMEKVSRLAYFV